MIFIKNLLDWANKRTGKYGAQYKTFGIFGIINYPLAYLYETFTVNDFNKDWSWFRLVSGLLCLGLLLKDRWSEEYKKFLPLYYYVTITISIPIFITFMLLKNYLSLEWLMNFNVAILVLILLLDSITFLIIESIGMLIGTAIFYISEHYIPTMPPPEHLNLFLYMFLCITILGSLFSRNKEKFHDVTKKIKDDLNIELEQKVIERTSELQRALDAKTEFLNNMSHEVRTPVQGITAISEGLVEHWDGYPDNERKFYAGKVAENARRLFSLVSNLLDLSRFTANKMYMNMAKGDLIPLINNMMDECRDLYLSGKEIELDFQSSISNATLICDNERMLQVLRNIFANAIKFTAKGKIIARLEECILTYDNGLKQEGYNFSLSDEGIGIPEGEEASIFDPFTQSTRTKTRAGGTGLGLAICRDIIDAHNGRIWASNNEVIGSTIYFEIPKKFSNVNASTTEGEEIPYIVKSSIISEDSRVLHKNANGDVSELEESDVDRGTREERISGGNGEARGVNEEARETRGESSAERRDRGTGRDAREGNKGREGSNPGTENTRREIREGSNQGTGEAKRGAKGTGTLYRGDKTEVRAEGRAKDITNNTNEIQRHKKDKKSTKTILLIDDEEAAHFSMKLILKDSGYNLLTATGGIDGLAIMQEQYMDIDLVLLDLMMPDMYGLNVLAAMREDANMCHLPVILQTGSNDVGELTKAKSLGVLNYIPKPYDKTIIYKILKETLK